MEMQPLDTLSISKKLRAGGYTKQQAETQAQVLIDVVNSNLATKLDIEDVKRDIEELRRDTKRDIEGLRKETKVEIASVRRDIEELRKETKTEFSSVRRDIKELEYRIKIFTGGMAFALFTALVAVMSAFKFLV